MRNDTSPMIDQAIRRGIHERPKDFGDECIPFSFGRELQKNPELSQLRQRIQVLLTQLPSSEESIGQAFVDYVRKEFVPSPALIELEKAMHYFYYKFNEAPDYAQCLDVASRSRGSFEGVEEYAERSYTERASIFYSSLVGAISRLRLPHGKLSLTSRDGSVVCNMGAVSPLLFSLQETAVEYYQVCHSHSRALVSRAFLSALAMEEERISRSYKLAAAEVQNALQLKFPANWINACWHNPAGDLWSGRGSLNNVRSILGPLT